MGLERIAAVLQGKLSSYETDLFAPLIARVSDAGRQALRRRRGRRRLDARHRRPRAHGDVPDRRRRAALERVARLRAAPDHAAGHAPRPHARPHRAVPLEDGGLGRRRDGRGLPGVVAERARIEDAVRGEEERFAETLDSGMRRIEEYCEVQGARARPRVDGGFLFTLYDTYGFPRDLAEEIFKERGWRRHRRDERDVGGRDGRPARARARGRGVRAGDEGETTALYQRLGAELPPIAVRRLRDADDAGADPGARARRASGCARRPRARRSR